MHTSVFDLFTIGIGPSSSHTVGPMRAARLFVEQLQKQALLKKTRAVQCELYGSLAATGKGHGSDRAVMMGLEGETPEAIDIDAIDERLRAIGETCCIKLLGIHSTHFDPERHLLFMRNQTLPFHPNGMTFIAYDVDDKVLSQKTYYSVGGGFVVSEDKQALEELVASVPYPFSSGEDLLQLCEKNVCNISDIMMANELVSRDEPTVRRKLLHIADTMSACIQRGCNTTGILPGGMKVRRRAADLYQTLSSWPRDGKHDPLNVLDWLNLYALAVSEENAAGGRVVTAPTNGAAGIIPAVMQYCRHFFKSTDDDIIRFLLTAAAIGSLYKENASISGADVGCQGEVGVASSMAAAALTELMGGTPAQVENAAEIGMEHNLGLTCDPVGGLVQVPCIERNAMGAVKALNAARMALQGDGRHFVSLDKVIKTMRDTGRDMQEKYKETSRGGLAVNVIEC